MLLELVRFLLAAFVLLAPGFFTAAALGMGETLLQRCAYGTALGIAGVIWLASIISHFTLLAFPFVWVLWTLAAGVAWLRLRRPRLLVPVAQERWLWLVLLAVAISRYAVALPADLPRGWDPAFHLILIKKIWLTQHSIGDWRPFVRADLNYPTGSHLLVVLLAEMSRLPLHTSFKDLEPFLGVMTTAQIYLLARSATGNASAALYSSAVYGLLTWAGSISYFEWGGVPNELAMALFITMLAIWLEPKPRQLQAIVAMALLYSALILAHHHVMLTSGMVIALALAWEWAYPTAGRPGLSRSLLLAVLLAVFLDLIFLIGYAGRIGSLHATGIVQSPEPQMSIAVAIADIGWVIGISAVAGVGGLLTRRIQCHAIVGIAAVALICMYLCCEFAYPALERHLGLTGKTFLTPSRFSADLNYFLVIFSGAGVAFVANRWRLGSGAVTLLIVAGSALEAKSWAALASPARLPAPAYVSALRWINAHTLPETIVINPNVGMDAQAWAPYLTWRRCEYTPLPDSEPQGDDTDVKNRAVAIRRGQVGTDAPCMQIVKVLMSDEIQGEPVLWTDRSGYAVIRIWPTH